MADYRTCIQSSMSADEAFSYMSDLRNFVRWDPGTVSAGQASGDGPGLGAAYDLSVKVAAGTLAFRYVTTDFDRPRRFVVKGTNRLFTSIDTITVEPRGSGSIVGYHAELLLNGPLTIFDKLLGKGFQGPGDKAAAGLERVLDGTVIERETV
ncbi:MAG: SRPBCC family protein [Actinomycetota bacterium]|nr:SRPBCC family protein [Actinomycetota bacterium]